MIDFRKLRYIAGYSVLAFFLIKGLLWLLLGVGVIAWFSSLPGHW